MQICSLLLMNLEFHYQVAIGHHYGSLRKFSALDDDGAAIRTSSFQDFGIPNDTIQSAVDSSGHIRVTRTKTKSKMPSSTEEFRKVMKVEMYAWLAMASQYKVKHWLHGLTSAPFLRFTEYILGDRVYGIQIPSAAGDSGQQKVKPDWSIVLAYEFKLRKDAFFCSKRCST